MEQIKDIFKQVRQAKDLLLSARRRSSMTPCMHWPTGWRLLRTGFWKRTPKDLAAMDPSNPKYDRLKLTAERIHAIAQGIRQVATLPSPSGRILNDRASQWHEADQGKCAFSG